MAQSAVKDPHKARAGRRGARSRWDADALSQGRPPGPRIVRLDQLDPMTRDIIRAILDARENAKAAAEGQDPATAAPEVQANARPAA